MLIEHSVADSARMEKLEPSTMIRMWLDKERFITIRAVNDGEAVLIEHFNAPGGLSFAKALNLQPNAYNGIVIK